MIDHLARLVIVVTCRQPLKYSRWHFMTEYPFGKKEKKRKMKGWMDGWTDGRSVKTTISRYRLTSFQVSHFFSLYKPQ